MRPARLSVIPLTMSGELDPVDFFLYGAFFTHDIYTLPLKIMGVNRDMCGIK